VGLAVGKGDIDCNSDGDGDSDSGSDAFNNQQMLQAVMECRGGLTMEEGAMMKMTESTNVPFGGVGKGDGVCNGDGDGNSDSDGNTFNNQQMLQAAMVWRRGLTVEEGTMMTTTESMNVPFGPRWRWRWQGRWQQWRRGRGDRNRNRNRYCHCDGNSNGDGNGNGISGGSSGDDDGGNKEGHKDKGKPGLKEGGALLTRRTREAMPVTVASQAV
jgi:hypothetical protein